MSLAGVEPTSGGRPARPPPSRSERDLLERYANDGAFLWHLRGIAVKSWAYDAGKVAAVDDRLEAHVDGLRVAGDDGRAALATAMDEDLQAGHVFLGAALSAERFDLRAIARLLDLAAGEPPLARAFASGLGWLPHERTASLLPGLLGRGTPPALRRIGVAACALHRKDPGPALREALYSRDAALRARAMKAAGELLLGACRRDVASGYGADEYPVRLWAAWSGALLSDPAATPVLQACAERPGRGGEIAAQMAVRRMDVHPAGAWVRDLFRKSPRAALLGAGALGDPAQVPWLLTHLKHAPWARLAGFALTLITGMRIEDEKLAGRKPRGYHPGPNDDPDDPNVEMEPDDGLPWPSPEAIEAWWSWRQPQLEAGTRLLLGRPIAPDWLAKVLETGSQPVRAAAAAEMALRRLTTCLPETRAKGAAWTP